MNTETRTTHALAIDGMKGDDCIKKVTHALKDVNDIHTKSVKVGTATIESTDDGCKDACKAVSAIGYKAHESKDAAQATADNNEPKAKPERV